MKRVSTAELLRNFGTYADIALSTPVIVTKSDRDRLVLTSIEQYEKLKRACELFEASEAQTASTHTKSALGRPPPRRG